MRAAAVVVLVAVLAGCGGDGDGDRGAVEPADPSTTGAVDATTMTTAPAEGITDLELLAPELLIRADELGVAGAEDVGYAPPAPSVLCAFDVDTDHPADVHVGAAIAVGPTGVTEALRVYADVDAAGAAYDAWVAAEPGCRPASPAVTGPTDVSDRVGADVAVSFTVPTRGGDDVLVLALVGDAVVAVRMLVTAPAEEGPLPPLDVAAFAVGKVLAALEA